MNAKFRIATLSLAMTWVMVGGLAWCECKFQDCHAIARKDVVMVGGLAWCECKFQDCHAIARNDVGGDWWVTMA